ncbi:ArdC family protein [Pelistega sp. MC2]|uniref:ArdC family protein n=1 Tax=Pelistega sp. MC2 TaxID=1720297 RepID=UPI0008DB0328|nr:zincin-like metallopeptidase domain-containing protein [Pelistega sp. MC2]
MANEKKESFAEQLAEKIIIELEKGTAPWQQPWTNSPRPYNAITGKPYRGANRLMLMVQIYKDPRYLTFNQAKEAGYAVRKGSRGIPLQKYIWEKDDIKKDEQGNPIKDNNGNVIKERVKLKKPIINYFTVFNADQIDGIPPLQLDPTEKNWDVHRIADEIIKTSGAVIKHEDGNCAYYDPSRDEIVLPHTQQFPSAQNYYDTVLHELGHWTGHESRLNRLTTAMFGTQDYAKEELRAEIASMMLGQDLGISHDTSNHLSYVANWIHVIKDFPYELIKACNDAERISSYVLDFAPEHIKEQINARYIIQEPEIVM